MYIFKDLNDFLQTHLLYYILFDVSSILISLIEMSYTLVVGNTSVNTCCIKK